MAPHIPFLISLLSPTLFTITTLAASHDILVGSTGLAFSPDSITAAAGDTLVFRFYPGHHNVVQGSFSTPCSYSSPGFYSGFTDSASGEASQIFTVTVNDTNPIWIYCSEFYHCQGGMSMVVNPPYVSIFSQLLLSSHPHLFLSSCLPRVAINLQR
jgi:plastocyanin